MRSSAIRPPAPRPRIASHPVRDDRKRAGLAGDPLDADVADVAHGVRVEPDVGVENLTGTRIDGRRADCGEAGRAVVIHRTEARVDVARVPLGVVGLDGTRIASLKPILSKALFHSRIPSRTAGR